MLLPPQIHIVDAFDIEQVAALGFTITPATTDVPDFINRHFPNFNLLQFARAVDDVLPPLTMEQLTKEVTLADLPPALIFQFYSADYDDDVSGLALSRVFQLTADGITVEHEFFRLPQTSRGQGIAKQLFQPCLQEYVNMGVKRIYVHAALQDGGYVWARNFFAATDQGEVTDILNLAEQSLPVFQFNAVKRIYDNYYGKEPAGTAFPIVKWAELPFMKDVLRGSHWQGVMDLTNAKQFSSFIKYIS